MKSVAHLEVIAPLPVVPPRPGADNTAGKIPSVAEIMKLTLKSMKPEDLAELLVRHRSRFVPPGDVKK